MNKLFLSILFFGLSIFSAKADYTLIVPSKTGTGTAIYANVIAKELSKHLNEDVIVETNGAAKGRVAIEKFNTTYKDDPKVIMLVHGGNANQYLIQDVGYDFRDWSPVMIQPYIVVTTIKNNFDWKKDRLHLADCSGCIPESMAWAMLKGWENITYVKKMSPGAAKKAWLRGDFNYIREPISRHIKNTSPLVSKKEAIRLFNHGLFQLSGEMIQDPNYPDTPTFSKLYERSFNKKPSGEFYEAYMLAAAWRDGLQKGLFMHKKEDAQKVSEAFKRMLSDSKSLEVLNNKLGKYPMFVGEDANKVMDSLYNYITPKALSYLVKVCKTFLGWDTAKFVEHRIR